MVTIAADLVRSLPMQGADASHAALDRMTDSTERAVCVGSAGLLALGNRGLFASPAAFAQVCRDKDAL